MRWSAPCLLVPAVLAALLRGAHLVLLAFRDPLFLHPVLEAGFHQQQAQMILTEGWLLPGATAYFKGPLYSYLLALLLSILGPKAGIVAARVLSLILGTLTVFLVARLARRLSGEDRERGTRAAWIAGSTTALCGTLIYFDATLLLLPLVTVLLVACAERMLVAARKANPNRDLALAGAILGLITIAQANALLALVAAAVWSFACARRRRWPGMQPWRAAALLLVPALLVILPVSLRNTFYTGDPVVVSWNGGIKLFMGNDPAFDQDSGNWPPDLAWTRLYQAPAALGSTRGSEHQRFFLRQSLARTLDRPAESAAILARKALRLFSAHEISSNRRISDARSRSPILAVTMWSSRYFILPLSLLLPLVAAGLVLGAGASRSRSLPLLALAAAWAATPVLFFNTAQLRLPAIVLLVPVAAAGWAAFDVARKKALAGSALAAALVFVLATVTIPPGPTQPLADEIHLARLAQSRGDLAGEIEFLARAVENDPGDPFARMRLGEAFARRGDCEDALPHYLAVLARGDLAADWPNGARLANARCLFELGRYDESLLAYTSFLDAEPDRPRTGARSDFLLRGTPGVLSCQQRLERLRAYEKLGRIDEAIADAAWVLVECEGAENLAARAHAEIRRLAEH